MNKEFLNNQEACIEAYSAIQAVGIKPGSIHPAAIPPTAGNPAVIKPGAANPASIPSSAIQLPSIQPGVPAHERRLGYVRVSSRD